MKTLSNRPVIAAFVVAFIASATSNLQAQKSPPINDGPANKYGNTLKRTPRPTVAAITEDDLKTRLYIFADDSMMGRMAGREGNMRGTAYIAREVQRLGLEPAGDNGTFFQGLPYYLRYYTPESQLGVGTRSLRFDTDFLAVPVAGRAPTQDFADVQIIYGGVAGDTTLQISAAQATGRIVVLSTNTPAATQRLAAARQRAADSAAAGATIIRVSGNLQVNDQTVAVLTQGANVQAAADSVRAAVAAAVGPGRGGRGGAAGAGGRGAGGGRGGGAAGGGPGRGGRAGGGGGTARFAGAAAIVTVDLEEMSAAQRMLMVNPIQAAYAPGSANPVAAGAVLGAAPAPVNIRVTNNAAAALMGVPMDSLVPGAAGGKMRGRLVFVDRYVPEYGRNVVAIIRGSDPVLRNEFVSIGAHNDHTGYGIGNAVDHDSLKAYRDALTKLQIRGTDTLLQATPELTSQIRVNIDSLRKIRPARLDSINNGADDDGSGSMAVLEIAEAIAMMPVKPKRSILFVWHTAEESGLNGSAFYAANPTVRREQIVANINMDMVGRGRAEDIPGGGPDYVAVVGADRLSTELGKTVQDVNKAQRRPLKLDAKFDLPTTWAGYNNIYGRSDHANYARYGIPIAFFFTGLHGDYHQRTDEPAYINYPQYNRIANYVRDLTIALGNAPTRPKVDRPG